MAVPAFADAVRFIAGPNARRSREWAWVLRPNVELQTRVTALNLRVTGSLGFWAATGGGRDALGRQMRPEGRPPLDA